MHSNKQITAQIRERVEQLLRQGLTHQVIADRFGVSRGLITLIKQQMEPKHEIQS